MRSVRKLLLALVLSSSVLPLSGCWSAIELTDRTFARIMMLDTADEGVELTLGFPLPNRMSSGPGGGGSPGPAPFTFITKTGSSIGDAYRKIQVDVPRRITFGQLRNIVFGKDFAEQGIAPVVDFAARVSAVHINANVFVSSGRVKEFTDIPVVFERFPTDILTAYVRTRVIVPVTVKDLLMSVYSGGDIVLPMLIFGHQGVVKEKNAKKWMSTDGSAILRKGVMVGRLNTKETRAALWILGKLENSEFSIPSPKDGKQVDFLVWGGKTKIQPKIDGNHIRFVIKCKAVANVLSTASEMNLTDVEEMRSLERKLENTLEERITKAIETTQHNKSDAFQLGNYVRWRYPKTWEKIKSDWRDMYETSVRVDPQVDITAEWYGTAQKPEWNRILSTKEGKK